VEKIYDKDSNQFVGFEIKCENPVSQKVRIDWFILEEK